MGLRDRAKRKSRQREIMGRSGTARQEREQLRAEMRATKDPGAPGRAAIKRVGEYKEQERMSKDTGVDYDKKNMAYAESLIRAAEAKLEEGGISRAEQDLLHREIERNKKLIEILRERMGRLSYEEDFDKAVEEDEKNKLKNRKKKLDEAIDG